MIDCSRHPLITWNQGTNFIHSGCCHSWQHEAIAGVFAFRHWANCSGLRTVCSCGSRWCCHISVHPCPYLSEADSCSCLLFPLCRNEGCSPACQFPLGSQFKWMKPVLLFISPSVWFRWLFGHLVSFQGLNQACFFSSIASVAFQPVWNPALLKVWKNALLKRKMENCCGQKVFHFSFTLLALYIRRWKGWGRCPHHFISGAGSKSFLVLRWYSL